jgi:hypothetical protein
MLVAWRAVAYDGWFTETLYEFISWLDKRSFWGIDFLFF